MHYLKLVVPFALLLACGGSEDGPPTDDPATHGPTVTSTVPSSDATAVATNLPIRAEFSRAMDPSSVNGSTFTLTSELSPVPGIVTYEGTTATFTPTALLPDGARLTASVTTGARDESGKALASRHSWSFTTVSADGAPGVSSTRPLDGAVDVRDQRITVTFNMPMDESTLNPATFTVMQGSEAVAGRVSYEAGSNTVTFSPVAPLGAALEYAAAISAGASSASGRALAQAHAWTFTTRQRAASGLPVDLGAAGNYVILAQTGISTVPASAITGDVAISPAAASYITGFSLTADATNTFATSPQITGRIYAADYAPPTPTELTTAVGDMGTAFTDAAGRPAAVTELGAGDIGGMTLAPGVYQWGTGLLIPTDLVLDGSATDVWIFQIAQQLTVSNGTRVSLTGGALAKNVFWQVSGGVELGTTVHMEGIILSQTAINLQTGASVTGRLLAESAVTIDASTVVVPAP